MPSSNNCKLLRHLITSCKQTRPLFKTPRRLTAAKLIRYYLWVPMSGMLNRRWVVSHLLVRKISNLKNNEMHLKSWLIKIRISRKINHVTSLIKWIKHKRCRVKETISILELNSPHLALGLMCLTLLRRDPVLMMPPNKNLPRWPLLRSNHSHLKAIWTWPSISDLLPSWDKFLQTWSINNNKIRWT